MSDHCWRQERTLAVVTEAFLDRSLTGLLDWLADGAPEVTALELGKGGYAPTATATGPSCCPTRRPATAVLTVGDGMDAETDVGPVASGAVRERITAIERGVADGAKLVVDGRALDGMRPDDAFVGPTILDEATADMPIVQEEVFGPVLSVVAPSRSTRQSRSSSEPMRATGRRSSRRTGAPTPLPP